ncbi:hypothetical protein B0H21DRAFT_870178 [Amylocystis lapponica]|nr:hypothetical protein B0H21DRAFT_870178 [Amylocystis lapponica]
MNEVENPSRHLASGGYEIIKLWLWDDELDSWTCGDLLPAPRRTPYSGDKAAIATSVQWLSVSSPNYLVVSYLYHGIVCSNCVSNGIQVLWTIHLPYCGSCSVSPDNDFLAICNISRGFDVYEIPAGQLRSTLEIPNEHPEMPLPVLYVHGGTMLLSGSRFGKVRLWKTDGTHWQSLRYKDNVIIQSLDAHYDASMDNFKIATGSSELGEADLSETQRGLVMTENPQFCERAAKREREKMRDIWENVPAVLGA